MGRLGRLGVGGCGSWVGGLGGRGVYDTIRGMNVYISGISGTGMGPLALMAQEAGLTVFGSDLAAGAVTSELVAHGIKLYLGEQNGEFLRARANSACCFSPAPW